MKLLVKKIAIHRIFINYLDPLVNRIDSIYGIDFVEGSSTKLLAYSLICRVLEVNELSSSVDSKKLHMDRTKMDSLIGFSARIVERFRILVYLADSADNISPFVLTLYQNLG